MKELNVKEVSISEIVKIHNTIDEFTDKNEDHFLERIKNASSLTIVVYLDSKPAGYALSYDRYDDESFYCWMVGVNSDYRKQGCLKAMMDYLFVWANNKGFTKILLKTRNNRREMLSYLVGHGWNAIEVHKKDDVNINRVLFEKLV